MDSDDTSRVTDGERKRNDASPATCGFTPLNRLKTGNEFLYTFLHVWGQPATHTTTHRFIRNFFGFCPIDYLFHTEFSGFPQLLAKEKFNCRLIAHCPLNQWSKAAVGWKTEKWAEHRGSWVSTRREVSSFTDALATSQFQQMCRVMAFAIALVWLI